MCGFTTSAAGRGSGPGESVKWRYWCLPAAGLVTCHECHNTAAAAVTLRVTPRDGTIAPLLGTSSAIIRIIIFCRKYGGISLPKLIFINCAKVVQMSTNRVQSFHNYQQWMSEVNIVRFLANICPKKLNRKHLHKKETGEEVVQTFSVENIGVYRLVHW